MPSKNIKTKKVEDDLIKNGEHFQSLLQNSSDAITIIDKKGIITFESSANNKISDFTRKDLIGKPLFDIVHLGIQGVGNIRRVTSVKDPVGEFFDLCQ